MRESVKRICQEIKSAQVEYEVAVNREMGHHPVLMDHQAFSLLKGKITHAAINMVSKEINLAKIAAEKFNHQVSFGIAPGDSVVIEPPGDKCIAECKLPLRFRLPCQCWLYQCVIDSLPIPISLIHPRWFYKGPPFVIFWKMTFNPSITFDKMLELAVSKEEESTKDLEQLETTVHKETIEIPSDKEEISTLIKPSSGDRFTRDGVDLLHSTALSSLDFYKSIQDSHRAEEYARDYSRMMEKLNKKWQEKEMARPMVPTTFSEPISTGNTKASMKKKTGRRFTGA